MVRDGDGEIDRDGEKDGDKYRDKHRDRQSSTDFWSLQWAHSLMIIKWVVMSLWLDGMVSVLLSGPAKKSHHACTQASIRCHLIPTLSLPSSPCFSFLLLSPLLPLYPSSFMSSNFLPWHARARKRTGGGVLSPPFFLCTDVPACISIFFLSPFLPSYRCPCVSSDFLPFRLPARKGGGFRPKDKGMERERKRGIQTERQTDRHIVRNGEIRK